jgi:hypothetical protein
MLRLINTHAPLDPAAWAAAHPQREDEGGMARIERLTAYKAAYALHQKCARAAGAKPTKLLGREYLRALAWWGDATRDAALGALGAARFAPALADAFVDGWARALEGDDAELTALVWAADFHEALRRRQRERTVEVAERRERLEAGESEAQALREAMARGADGPGEEEEEERIVEV